LGNDLCREARAVAHQIAHAQNFSELMHGAALLYNFMLACRAKRKRLRDEYRENGRGRPVPLRILGP
jgi:hypothetical protein